MQSFLLGTLGLDVLLVVAVIATWTRRLRPDPKRISAVRRAARIAIAVQAGHATEELLSGFHVAFPAAFGLEAWSPALFASFNATWLALWIVANQRPATRPSFCVLAFLALGSLANLPAHAALAVATGGWFPGLATAPFGAWAGLRLARALVRQSRPRGSDAPDAPDAPRAPDARGARGAPPG